jgi:hypothetical protein
MRVIPLIGALRDHRAGPLPPTDDLQRLAAAHVLDPVQGLTVVLADHDQPPPLMPPGNGESLLDLGTAPGGLTHDPHPQPAADVGPPDHRARLGQPGHLRQRDFPNQVVEVVGDIEGVGAIHSEPVRQAQQSRGGRAAVTVEVRDARAGDRADLPVSRDLPDPVVCVVGDVDIAGAVHRQPIRKVQPS